MKTKTKIKKKIYRQIPRLTVFNDIMLITTKKVVNIFKGRTYTWITVRIVVSIPGAPFRIS